jgi:hypothetical protein
MLSKPALPSAFDLEAVDEVSGIVEAAKRMDRMPLLPSAIFPGPVRRWSSLI